MSRTFRRFKGNHSLAGWGNNTEGLHLLAVFKSRDPSIAAYDFALRKVIALYHSDKTPGLYRTKPSSYRINWEVTRPVRAAVRSLNRHVLHLKDLEDTPLYPTTRGWEDPWGWDY